MIKHEMSTNKCVSLQLLEGYRKGTISKQERVIVEQHLSSCELCRYITTNNTQINERELAEDVPLLRKSITKTLMDRKRKKRRPVLYKIAAALAFFVTMGTVIQFFSSTMTTDSLYSDYYHSYEIPEKLLRSATNTDAAISAPLAQAIAEYKDLPYKKPSTSTPTTFDYDPAEAALTQLLQGLVFLENGQIDLAIPVLEKVQQSKTKFSEDATWYLALAHLKKEESKTAIQFLDQILVLQDSFYYDNAKALKEQLVELM